MLWNENAFLLVVKKGFPIALIPQLIDDQILMKHRMYRISEHPPLNLFQCKSKMCVQSVSTGYFKINNSKEEEKLA